MKRKIRTIPDHGHRGLNVQGEAIEKDPVFTASPAYDLNLTDIANIQKIIGQAVGAYILATANYIPLVTDYVIEYQTGPFSVNLAAVASYTKNVVFSIKNSNDTELITVNADGSELIDGLASQIAYPGDNMVIMKNATGWVIL